MLCQICEAGIRDAALRLEETPKKSHLEGTSGYERVTGDTQVVVQLHSSIEGLHSSIATGCLFCRNLWVRRLYERPSLQGKDGRINLPLLEHITTVFRAEGQAITQMTLETRHDSIIVEFSDHGDWGSNGIKYFMSRLDPIEFDNHVESPVSELHTSTKDSVSLWRKWYTICKQTHHNCRLSEQNSTFRPKRLIQVYEKDSEVWSLVDETMGIVEPYATLSHCWGASQPRRLMKEDLPRFKERNLVSELPKTFVDAIDVAKSLGIYYIWIDSLCIIQDDQEDWREQSSLMRSVYTYADCNIAASWSTGSSGGLFSTSDAALKDATYINLGFEFHGCPMYQFSRISSFENDVVNAPLNTRAWVSQERYLARRQLSFTASQAYWECPELVANEQCPSGLTDNLWTRQQSLSMWRKRLVPTSEEDFRRIWSNIVEQYSGCALTKKTDKVIALSGLADHLQRTRHHTGNLYVQGLWSRDFHRQLCWTSHFSESKPKQLDRSIAPTWSWLNLDGKVQQDDAYNNPWGKYRIPWVQAEDDGIITTTDGPLSLTGIALFGTLQNHDPFGSGRYEDKVLLSRPLESPGLEPLFSLGGTFDWNVSEWPGDAAQPRELCFFMVNMSLVTEEIHGLILWQVPSAQGHVAHVRLGTLTFAGMPGRHTTSRTPLMQHIAARQGLPRCTEVIQNPGTEFAFAGAHGYMKTREQRAERVRWEMDLNRTDMKDLVYTVHIQ
ncbi:hypothetical protein PFICI_13409 [Pestalotiopsis fici W106-1]|uniref:Heterokaryon incompatibility domain-containing protein n=1 Tax=Pestalotiopsis fici (strain W106-1 / CGMCC3.15140) TaxID=1229662 RepID=W3WLX3_PESFW|nr:uncharacterized protein PFICI_13409 [Pestalotiopsis fici W106-1]ETS74925.1 hypothetical protein PFICI_13409 [Pestalotiopsis fici W106-1]